jgi:hypothetical protein
MQLRLAAPVAVLALAGATLPAVATTSRSTTRVEFASSHVVRGDLGPATGAPIAWAARALRAQAKRLGIDASTYRLESVRTSLIGTHVRGRQYRGGVPIVGTDVLVSAVNGRIAQVDAFGSTLPGAPVAHPVGELVAKAAALGHLHIEALYVPVAVERVLVPGPDGLVDTYRVSLVASKPARVARLDVDAATGRVLGATNDEKYVDGKAKVFDPNPIQWTGNTKLRQPAETHLPADADADSPELTAARTFIPVKGLDSQALTETRLTGPWVNVLGIAGYVNSGTGETPTFDVTRGDPRFEGLMAYAHLDRYQRYLQSLGFKGSKAVNAESQDVVAAPIQGYDNSFYQPGNDVMVLGAGGVDDGEDAEVIVHEYGHAMQDAQVPGWGNTAEGGAMGEGFGDFNAANFYARTNTHGEGFNLCLMEWDSTTYATPNSSANPTCIRRMDSTKTYPKSMVKEVHDDGEMWETFLWRVRSHLKGSKVQKSDAAIRLVLTSHELLTPNANFDDAVAALRTAARALKHPEYQSFINAEAKRIGFPLNP